MRFKSAVDPWFYLLALGLPAAILIYAVSAVGMPDIATLIIILVIAVLAIGLPVWLLFSTYYEVVSGILRICSGPFRWEVPIKDIRSVKASRSVISAPALSLNRLEIQYGQRQSILVSPEDIQGFKQALGFEY